MHEQISTRSSPTLFLHNIRTCLPTHRPMALSCWARWSRLGKPCSALNLISPRCISHTKISSNPLRFSGIVAIQALLYFKLFPKDRKSLRELVRLYALST